MAPRIGFINIGHPDYENDIGAALATDAVESLRARGVVVIGETEACTEPVAAMRRGQELAGERLDGFILWLGTWIECPTATAAVRELEHLPFAIWGFNMVEREGRRESTGSFVATCMLKGALERMGYSFKVLVGEAGEATLDSAEAFCRAAHAAMRLKRTRLGLVGYASMGMYPGTFDHALLRRHIGPEVVHIDTYSLVRMAEAVGREEAKDIADDWAATAQVAVEEERLLKAARLAAALRTLVNRHKLHALNVKCQYELSQEWGMTPCVPLSWLADQGVITGCEGDVPTTVAQCILAYLSGRTVAYADILDLEGRRMLLSACGFAPFSLSHEPRARICELGHPGFDGIISSCTLKRGPVTFAQLVQQGDGWRLNYGTGVGVETDLRQGRFPALQVELDGAPGRLMETIASQHWALCHGDVTGALGDLCRIVKTRDGALFSQ